jgi:hypothetical protein
MSTKNVTPEDYKFFDLLAPYTWPKYTKKEIALLREQVEHGMIHIETMLENALARASKGLFERSSENGRDGTDGSDAKKACSAFRNNSIKLDHWLNTFSITNLKNKKGVIRAVCYSKQQDRFYFFAFPYKSYQGKNKIEIVLDNSVGYKEPQGIPKGKWSVYQVHSFEELATITNKQAEKLPKLNKNLVTK